MILHLNAEVGGFSVRLKIKKKKKIEIKTTKANRKQQQKIKYYCQAGIRTTIACVEAKTIATGVLFHMASLQIYKIFVQISVHRMGDQQ